MVSAADRLSAPRLGIDEPDRDDTGAVQQRDPPFATEC
jgi:hypothetical protein